ncbi:hypothetical protein G3N55_12000 [Dissulfurirhabdus thermomarina]|uniref:Sulfurtransferase n=1 Tax=Dissulfurirhabdus thermomarina TaxID=1765737 RepID=A0A6N9TVV6_DISTH|nr:hypothetical protein [Dissulfurirhabdus thermomarina]NDY43557.1 hypothetical protein [Dissulfurirhabdus thermomarina]NMX22703.1 hypothetical protein [Dissulfurirhabdus thermomarina]
MGKRTGTLAMGALVVLAWAGAALAVELPAPTGPEHVFHPMEVTVGGATYFIPDPAYNVWPGPGGVVIDWTAGGTVVYSAPYEAAAELLRQDGVYLVDVRTKAEWVWVGHPGPNKKGEGAWLEGKVFNISSAVCTYDSTSGTYQIVPNKFFTKDLIRTFDELGIVDPTLITMCRSGHRSVAAGGELQEPSSVRAAKKIEALGAYRVLNMLTGFEGGADEFGYRTLPEGWKNLGLPYNNSGAGAYYHPGQ